MTLDYYFGSIFFIVLVTLSFKTRVAEGIISGEDAVGGQFKYQVSVQTNDVHICGGGIIAPQFVLTAAQCIIAENNSFFDLKYKIIAGVTDLRDVTNPNRVVMDVVKAFVPLNYQRVNPNIPNYRPSCDIAVLKLKYYLSFREDSELLPLKLPAKQKNYLFLKYMSYKGVIAGFGEEIPPGLITNQQESKMSDQLKFSLAKVLRLSKCLEMLNKPPLGDHHLCAQVKQSQRTTNMLPEGVCFGDTGGPLVINGDTVIGVLSQPSSICNEKKESGIYTRVTSFVNFIEESVKEQSKPYIRVADYQNRRVLEIVTGRLDDIVPSVKQISEINDDILFENIQQLDLDEEELNNWPLP